jgi:folate-binding protein YgfZ
VSTSAYELSRDAIRVEGPDAITFLQGQVSQDVAGLAIGMSAFTFILEPQGKVDVWGRVTRVAADAVVVDVDGGYGEAAMARLNRFKLRTKATIELLPWRSVAVRDDLPPGLQADVVAGFDWPHFTGVDLLGPSIVPPAGAIVHSAEHYERRRIEAGVPRLGHELDANTIPAEAGPVVVARSVSFTKGCYTGQELVARVDSRGNNTPRNLRRVVITGGVPERGADVTSDGIHIGVLTSVAATATGAVALASIRRGVEVPSEARIDGFAATVEALPA